MEYLLSLALLVLNLIDYQRDLGHFAFTAVSAVLFALLFFFVHKKTKNFLASCIVMMCHTWQISWINIFGDSTSELQLPWFYILGLFIVVYAVFNVKKCMLKEYSIPVLLIFVYFLIIFNYPLVISPWLSEGLKGYIMVGFFMIVLLAAYIYRDDVPAYCYDLIKSAFIWAAFTTSFFLVFQFVMYERFGVTLFKITLSQYYSKSQVSCHLLMEDHSCSTIMIGCSVFYIIERITKKRWFIYHYSLQGPRQEIRLRGYFRRRKRGHALLSVCRQTGRDSGSGDKRQRTYRKYAFRAEPDMAQSARSRL